MSLEYYGFSVHTKAEKKDSKNHKNYELEYYEKKLKEGQEYQDSLFSQTNTFDDLFSDKLNFNLFDFKKPKLNYNFSSATNIRERLVERARVDAYNTDTTGWCYKSVAKVLADEGLADLRGESAYMAAGQLSRNPNFTTVTNRDIKPGDIIVIGKGGPGNPDSDLNKYGHIMVAGDNGQGYSDHAQQIDFSKYGGREIHIFRTKST